jgi:outer membrane protein assembly factor BamA
MKLKMIAWLGGLAAATTIGAVPPANAAKEKVYTLGGYTFGGFAGVNTDELSAKLKDQAGARVTRSDLNVDQAMFTAELKERHIRGRLLTTFAEKKGTVWLIFDLQPLPTGTALYSGQPMKAQAFEGATRISARDLSAATGLKPGDTLSYEKIRAAHDAILALYARSAPGKAPTIRSRAQVSGTGEITLTWLIGEQ